MTADRNTETAANPWRETVRDMYDDLHFGQINVFTGNRLAKRLIKFIEDRHPGFFNEPHQPSEAKPNVTRGHDV